MEYLLDRIKEVISPLLSELEIDLVNISFKRSQGRLILQLLVDKYSGGITLDDCAVLNQRIGEILDNANLLQEQYALEVSSPGLDRPLIGPRDFKRVSGSEIRVFLSKPINGQLQLSGKLINCDEESITLIINSQELKIPLSQINKAKQIIK